MSTVEYKPTNNKTGESLKNFESFGTGDLIVADRAYGTKASILHCLDKCADYIFRIKYNAFRLYDSGGDVIDINERLSKAAESEAVDFTAYFKNGKELVPVRVCAIKKAANIEWTFNRN